MLSCRMCTENPFSFMQALFGGEVPGSAAANAKGKFPPQQKPADGQQQGSQGQQQQSSGSQAQAGGAQGAGGAQASKSSAGQAGGGRGGQITKRVATNFQRRAPAAIKDLVKQWEQFAHPRAREFFPTQEQLSGVLTELARGINKEDDPVLGDDSKCVFWYGDITKEDQQAAIRMVKPGENVESITFVNRVLAFIFATDDSFEELIRLPKEPFKMSCGDQLCVNLSHISLQTWTNPNFNKADPQCTPAA